MIYYELQECSFIGYGSYDPDKWNTNLMLKEYFESKMGMDLYVAVDKKNYRP